MCGKRVGMMTSRQLVILPTNITFYWVIHMLAADRLSWSLSNSLVYYFLFLLQNRNSDLHPSASEQSVPAQVRPPDLLSPPAWLVGGDEWDTRDFMVQLCVDVGTAECLSGVHRTTIQPLDLCTTWRSFGNWTVSVGAADPLREADLFEVVTYLFFLRSGLLWVCLDIMSRSNRFVSLKHFFLHCFC